MISVIVPTIDGREHHLERCLSGYEAFTDDYEIIEVRNQETCGAAWRLGAEQAEGDYLHFTADDLLPHEGWSETAISCVEDGNLPCPRIWQPSGALESCGEWGQEMPDGTETNIARVPFLSRSMWEQGGWILEAHYFTDNHIWLRGQQLGIPTVVCHGYEFTHWYAQEGRKTSMDEDLAIYQRAGGRF